MTATSVTGSFREDSTTRNIRATPLSHLSVELGHLYEAELALDEAGLVRYFDGVRAALPAEPGPRELRTTRLRASTCLLVDDYSATPQESPATLLPRLLAAAEQAGLTVDYLAREAACARTADLSPAELVVAALVTEPPEGTTGIRPPVTESGWLCNGTRSPAGPAAAMSPATWQPPRQAASAPHSIFVDVELWSTSSGDGARDERTWSCPALAATWQLLRLGLLRSRGQPVWAPTNAPETWPDDWRALPALVQLRPEADPFAAYRTLSVLPLAYLQVEAAVRTILSQVYPDPAVLAPIDRRARAENVHPPDGLCDRLAYAFVGG